MGHSRCPSILENSFLRGTSEGTLAYQDLNSAYLVAIAWVPLYCVIAVNFCMKRIKDIFFTDTGVWIKDILLGFTRG